MGLSLPRCQAKRRLGGKGNPSRVAVQLSRAGPAIPVSVLQGVSSNSGKSLAKETPPLLTSLSI